jgi:16S rRNA (cytosine967-C5)-methyltransferase
VQNYQLNNDKEDIKRILRNKCDWILLDVPCSGTGTIRRNPDLKYKFSLERLEETLQTQEKIFEEALDLLNSRGKIVYVTCSILKEENINQVMKFCRKFGVKIDNDTIFQTEPRSKRMDGFFSVTLKL